MENTSSISVAVLGCGRIASDVHLPLLARLSGVKVAALAEPDERLQNLAAARFPAARVESDWRRVVGLSDVDAVVVCLPSGLHAEAGMAAFEAGKHVYLEKPIGTNIDEAARLLLAWRGSGRVGMVGFNYRFAPLFEELKRQVEAGRIGRPVTVRATFATAAGELPVWKKSRSSGGGVLLDLASHQVDLLRFLLGAEVEEVVAKVDSIGSEDDTASVQLRFAGDLTAQCFFCLGSVEENVIEVFGTEGKLAVDAYRSAGVAYTAPSRQGDLKRMMLGFPSAAWAGARRVIDQKLLHRGPSIAYERALKEFVEAIRDGRQASCNLDDGFASLAVIDAAEQSSRTGVAVTLQRKSAAVGESKPLAAADRTKPRMSVVAVTPDVYETIAQTVRRLAAQTVVGQIELIICTPDPGALEADRSQLDQFHTVQILESTRLDSMGTVKAAAVAKAAAPFVVFAEDHSFPDEGWGASLLEAYDAGYPAVGPQIKNANPWSMFSWADLFLGFGSWVEPRTAGIMDRLPWHNSGYDRQLLLQLGKQMAPLLENEGLLQARLLAEGKKMFLVGACTAHVNVTKLRSFLRIQYHGGRSFGGNRARDQKWPLHRRVIHVVAAPAVPLLRLRGIFAQVAACGRSRQLFPGVLPYLLLGLAAHAFGEAMGIAIGAGGSGRRKCDFEYHRDHHISANDRAALGYAMVPQT